MRTDGSPLMAGAIAAIIKLIPTEHRPSVLMNLSRCAPQDRRGALQEAAVAALEGRITPAGAVATFARRQIRCRCREIPLSQFDR